MNGTEQGQDGRNSTHVVKVALPHVASVPACAVVRYSDAEI